MPDPFESSFNHAAEPELEESVPLAAEDDEYDAENNDYLYLKYCFEGAASVSELSTSLRQLADDLDRRVAEGWSLGTPVDSGQVHLTRTSAVGNG